jgi:flagellin
MLSIQTNYASLVAQNNLTVNSAFQTKTIGRITSGYRINNSSDDAAGLAVANNYRSQVAELSQGVLNANAATSNLQIIDGGLNNISNILDRMKTLATEGTNAADLTSAASEYADLVTELGRQADSIGLGKTAGGNAAKAISVYVGGGATTGTVTIDLTKATDGVGTVDAASLGASLTITGVVADVTAVDTAIANLGKVQAAVGSGENRLNYATQLAQTQIANNSAAESQIRDADMATEAANLTKAQVLQQASVAAMAQANAAPQAVLSLLKG